MNSYEQITKQIIANLEHAKTWSDMINHQAPINITGRAYNGINRMLLYNSEYKSRIWGTFNQIIKHGGRIRQSESSSIVAFWSRFTPKEKHNEKPKERWYLKVYHVFNIDQCEFIEDNEYLEYLQGKLNEDPISASPNELISDYLNRENIVLRTTKEQQIPFYSASKDLISIPERSLYKNNDEYYMTLFHELTHSTGHPKRLNRFEVGSSNFGSEEYSLEELIAEIGANFLSAETGLNPDYLNSVGYIKHWIPSLKEHPRWIVSAAAKAEKAVGFIVQIDIK